jgi:hypothetical protein
MIPSRLTNRRKRRSEEWQLDTFLLVEQFSILLGQSESARALWQAA